MVTGEQKVNFVCVVYGAARELSERCPEDSVSPVFVTAQAALETGYRLGGIKNNIFGITKGGSWTGATELVLTTEYFNSPDRRFVAPERVVAVTEVSAGRWRYSVYRLFRVYDTLGDCLADHLAILKKPGYADAWPYRHDAREFARRISDSTGARYATAPDYAAVMGAFIGEVERIARKEGLC
jgi:flagellar protein FlgJ